jgi:hypothetical protein
MLGQAGFCQGWPDLSMPLAAMTLYDQVADRSGFLVYRKLL